MNAAVYSYPPVLFLLVPRAHAFSLSDLSLKTLVDEIIALVGGLLIPFSIAVLFLIFLINIVLYLYAIHTGQEKDMVSLARKRLLYPVFVLFAVFSLWGFIELIRILFGG